MIVDAAAEVLTIPNVHLQRGATAVAYSGGKCIRGPQAAGLLLGEKNLLQAAWANSAPHHAFGRSLKVGKEEIMGMLAAVEMWNKRDHKAEWQQVGGWLDEISDERQEGGWRHDADQAARRACRTARPRSCIQWDGAKVGITGQEVSKTAARYRAAHRARRRDRQPARRYGEFDLHHALHDDAGRREGGGGADSMQCFRSRPSSKLRRVPQGDTGLQSTGQWDVTHRFTAAARRCTRWSWSSTAQAWWERITASMFRAI